MPQHGKNSIDSPKFSNFCSSFYLWKLHQVFLSERFAYYFLAVCNLSEIIKLKDIVNKIIWIYFINFNINEKIYMKDFPYKNRMFIYND